ncbi:MAG: hypothetical protein V4616_15100 [Bacteroidota bacterium]
MEEHPFSFFIPEHPKSLILGSFPCRNTNDYGSWFYCGSGKNLLWPILSELYNMPVASRSEMETLLVKHKIAIGDIYTSVKRRKPGCNDSDLYDCVFNHQGIEECVRKGVTRILCTSKYVAERCVKELPHLEEMIITLPSPSPSGSRPIGRSEHYKELRLNGTVNNTKEYRLLSYRDAFKM